MPAEIVIVDYGMGNLRSVQKALEAVGAKARISSEPRGLKAEGLVLPGVGAFRDAMERLRAQDMAGPILEHVAAGRPFLGICLGLHLLFTEGEEFGLHRGLDIVPGRVVKFAAGKKIPHMGWNAINIVKKGAILEGIPEGAYFYFVHSYYARPSQEGWVGATTDYGEVFPSVLLKGNVFATQFHPEKSQRNGLKLLANFSSLVSRSR